MRAGRCIYHALLALEEMDGEEGAGRVITALQELSAMACARGRKVGTIANSPSLPQQTRPGVSPAGGDPKPPTPTSSCGVASGPVHSAPAVGDAP